LAAPGRVLNIDGVANVTYIDQNDHWVAFDTGSRQCAYRHPVE
jgi:1,6-anhydro-N-acetylmuramate kinase